LVLQRWYWFTIELGLIQELSIKLYGVGIISSFDEINGSLKAKHLNFDIEMVLNKSFNTDLMKEEYFVIESYNKLFESINIAENLLSKKYELVN
jgi:phenylalanine-4-hydroxylase